MAVDTNTTVGKLLEKYVNLFSNRWNHDCDICWFILGQSVAAILFLGIGFALGKVL